MLQVLSGLNPCFPSDLTYKVVNVMDVPWENIQKHFHTCIKFIKEAITNGGTVFVHCYGGVSRSATIVCAYLMKELGMPMLHALGFLRQKRSVVFPNAGFQRQLLDFEKHLLHRTKPSLSRSENSSFQTKSQASLQKKKEKYANVRKLFEQYGLGSAQQPSNSRRTIPSDAEQYETPEVSRNTKRALVTSQ